MSVPLRVILVVDDADDRALASMVLRQNDPDTEVFEVGDALAFADLLASESVNVAVCAPSLQWAQGEAVLAAVKRRFPDCATVLFGDPVQTSTDSAVVDVVVPVTSRGFLALPQAIEQAFYKAQAEERGSDAMATYERLLERVPIGIFQLAVDESFRDANEAALRVLGYGDVETLIGRRLPDLLVEVDLRMKCRALIERGQPLSELTTELRRADGGSVKANISFWPVIAGTAVSHFEGVLWDVSALTHSKEVTEGGFGADELASALSHDLQDPLQVITQYAQLLKERHGAFLNEDALRLIARVGENASRMQSMIDGIVEFSNVGTLTRPFQVVDMNQIVADAMSNLELVIKRSEAEIEYGELTTVIGEPRQLLQLIQNLVSNAIKYRSEAPPHIRIGVSERDRDWLISVADNGIGLDPQVSDRVFGMFQRLHTAEEIPGRGLGLAICKKIAQCHGGRIWVESTPGHGSTFFVTVAKDAQALLPKRDRRQGLG